MKSEEIIAYINHYMDKCLVKGVVMMTGSWGVGKSFFIHNELISALSKDRKCIVIINNHEEEQ